MKIDFDTVLVNPKNEPFRAKPDVDAVLRILMRMLNEDPNRRIKDVGVQLTQKLNDMEGEPQTLADVCYEVLSGCKKAQEGNAGEKRARARLAARVVNGGIVEIGEEDLDMLREEIAENCNALAMMACEDALEEIEEEEPEAAEAAPEPEAKAS